MALVPVLWIMYRIGKAFVATFRLLFDFRLMRALPWRYIVRLPRRDIWIAIAATSMVIGAIGVVGAAVLPSPLNEKFANTGLLVLLVGIVASWVRVVVRWWRLRRSRRRAARRLRDMKLG